MLRHARRGGACGAEATYGLRAAVCWHHWGTMLTGLTRSLGMTTAARARVATGLPLPPT